MPLSLTVSEIFNVKYNAIVDVTLIRPLNKGQGHAHFQGKLFVRLLVIPHTKPRTKFEVSSSSSFRDIAL